MSRVLAENLGASLSRPVISSIDFSFLLRDFKDKEEFPEITRFKGLGEISPDEFKYFIGDDIRLDPVMLDKQTTIEELLLFYMGKNTPDRQKFIINNLKVELDYAEETIELAQ